MWCVLQLFYVNEHQTILGFVGVCLKEQRLWGFPKGLNWLWYYEFVKTVHMKLLLRSLSCAAIYSDYVLHGYIHSAAC
jgi:hypothetical protein